MNIKEILDKLDSKIFPEEIKSELVESFTSAVSEKVAEVTNRLETEYIDKEIKMEQKYTGKIEKFYESERQHMSEYLEQLEEEINSKLITKYADEVLVEDTLKMYRKMQNFLSESGNKLNVTPKQIDESAKSNSKIVTLESELSASKEKFNKLVKFSLIKEHYDKITQPSVQKQFEKLAEEFEFDNIETFNRKLDRLQENLGGEYQSIVESVKKEIPKKAPVAPTPKVEPKKENRLAALKESLKNRSITKAEIITESEVTEDDFGVDVY